jgi:hypothetical protein
MSKQVETHVYQPDSSLRRDWNGSYPCTCGLPKRNQHHEVKPTDEEVKALEDRKLGEARSRDSAVLGEGAHQ